MLKDIKILKKNNKYVNDNFLPSIEDLNKFFMEL